MDQKIKNIDLLYIFCNCVVIICIGYAYSINLKSDMKESIFQKYSGLE